jgi:hypothetical protein
MKEYRIERCWRAARVTTATAGASEISARSSPGRSWREESFMRPGWRLQRLVEHRRRPNLIPARRPSFMSAVAGTVEHGPAGGAHQLQRCLEVAGPRRYAVEITF